MDDGPVCFTPVVDVDDGPLGVGMEGVPLPERRGSRHVMGIQSEGIRRIGINEFV